MDHSHFFETNQKLWNTKTPTHIKSEFYNMPGFIKGATSLKAIELGILPNLEGKSILHPQCHFGQDTLSLERMGAHCTGVDFSNVAIEEAKALVKKLGMKSKFVCCNVLDMDKYVQDIFDIVFCSYGVITWLPNLSDWAHQIAQRLKSGGQFYFVEFHPLLYMFNWENHKLEFEYFNKNEPEIEVEKGTYADKSAPIEMKEYFWTHSISEIINALISNGLRIDAFNEYDYSPYNIFETCEIRNGNEYIYNPAAVKIPHVMSIKATKI